LSAPPDADCIDGLETGLVTGYAARVLAGEDLDLLAPLEVAIDALPAPVPAPPVGRAELARAIGAANAAYGHPAAAALAEKLARPGTEIVVTGQQTGLLGGPLLALVKAAAAVRWAEALEAAGRSAVAVFWMATEDHDYREVAEAAVPTADGVRTLTLGDDPQPLAPVGLRTLGPEIVPRLEELAALHPTDWFRAWIERLAGWWRPEARFGEAFARQAVATLGARAPLYLDALLPELKRAERPHLAALVARRLELERWTREREAEIERRGLTLQVAPQPGASPLFLVRGLERRRIEWRGADRWTLRGGDGAEEPVERLLETIEDNPAAVSPGVLARVAVQDAVLQPTLFVVGPGELAYLPQAAMAHRALEVAPPRVALRPRALVFDRRARGQLADLGGSLEELVARPEAIARRIAERAGGGFVAPVRAEIATRLATLAAPAAALDAGLERPLEKTRETVERALEAFSARVEAAAARRDEQASRRLEQLVRQVAPLGRPQERVISSAFFPGRYGEGFGAALLDQLSLDPRRLAVVDPG
jgi:bacillithiol biosynthesis cysteine-adding enzyme BshC